MERARGIRTATQAGEEAEVMTRGSLPTSALAPLAWPAHGAGVQSCVRSEQHVCTACGHFESMLRVVPRVRPARSHSLTCIE